MNLLPKSTGDFATKGYWDSFFQKRTDAFEWYGEYTELCGVLHKYCKPSDGVLVAGCGNSHLSENLYDVGYRSLVNVDISEVVIQQMNSRNNAKRPEMKFQRMDLMDMEFEDQIFQVVLDKGTLDAIFANDENTTVEKVSKMLREIARVLKVGGRYICISLAQKHILNSLIEYFVQSRWLTRVHTVKTNSTASSLPVFAFVFTKTKPMLISDISARMPLILEIVYDDSEKATRLDDVTEFKKSVFAIQEYALVKQHLKTLHHGEVFHLDLWSATYHPEPRYSLAIIDLKPSKSITGKYAIFIVPQGREHEWMFSVKEGQEQLAKSAEFQRLVIVALNRGHSYNSVDDIKKELSERVMEFAQDGIDSSAQVPFLSIGDNIGNRKVVHHGSSALTGDYVVEDVKMNGEETFRHLIFLSNKNVVQSEAKLCMLQKESQIKSSKKKKSGKKVKSMRVDFSYLACQHHQAIIAGFALLPNHENQDIGVLLIGLGGGGLPMFINTHFPNVHATVVELDPDIVDVAKNWFGFEESQQMKLIVDDGLEVLKHKSKLDGRVFDVVIFDIDSKDASKALSCPPATFIEEGTLNQVKNVLSPGGLFFPNSGKQSMYGIQNFLTFLFVSTNKI